MISVKDFVKAHFEEYIGKMYHTEGAPFIWFAFDKGTTLLDALRKAFCEEASVEAVALNGTGEGALVYERHIDLPLVQETGF